VLRLFLGLVIAPVLLTPASASELILTGISASGGNVRAFFSAPGGASTFSLRLHEEYAGIRLERVNRRAQQVWIVESGEGRWMGLGDPKTSAGLSASALPGSGMAGIPETSVPVANGLPRRRANVAAPDPMMAPASAPGSASDTPATTTPGMSGAPGTEGTAAEAAHRWKPGVVRDPTGAEVYRAQYGSAALDAAVRNGQIRKD
jgi:hypothetical protein